MPLYPWLRDSSGSGQVLFSMTTPGGTGRAQCEIDYQSAGGSLLTGPAQASADAANWFTFWANRVMPVLCAGNFLVEAKVVLWDGSALQEAIHSGSVDGSVSGENMPPQVAVLVQKVTGLPGRENRGRFYLPGIPVSYTSSSNSGQLSSGAQGTIQAAVTALYSDAAGAELPMRIYSRKQIGTPPAYHQVNVSSLNVEPTYATQRRRMRKAAHR